MAALLENIQKAFRAPDPKELVRKWQAELRAEQRKIDRQIRGKDSNEQQSRHFGKVSQAGCTAARSTDIQFEEKKVHKTIKDAAKRNDMATCKVRVLCDIMLNCCVMSMPQSACLNHEPCLVRL
jgi:hypothetical protein